MSLEICEDETKTDDCFREIGFNTEMRPSGTKEEIFFILGDVRRDNASEEAVREFITYWQNQIEVAKDYIANGKNNKTHEWAKATKPLTHVSAITQEQ